ncbi:MAG: hypothetical protein NTY01_05715 [Verrucomicrobia bacterium]|nr:hypothetical protein [Verrucomicrobiota bacterium]
MIRRTLLAAMLAGEAAVLCPHAALAAGKVFRAGAAVVDVTPPKFPVIVNGYTFERTASNAIDRLAARALVLDDGACRVAVVVVDSCVMPRTLLDRAKELAKRATGIPTGRMLISATHTHSAPSVLAALGSREDPDYAAWLPGRIAEAVVQAQRNLAPARVGWTVAAAPELTHCRLWIMAPGSVPLTSFGESGKRILMVPSYAGPSNIGPAGPVDADVTLLSVQSPGGLPIALLANYGMHFYGAGVEPLSADWCGQFCEQIQTRIAPEQAEPRFVAIMSQGTSGDQHWMDFSRPAVKGDHKSYAASVVKVAHAAYQNIRYHDWVPLAMRERELKLTVRKVPEARMAWAKPIAETLGDRVPRTREEVYAREQILLSKTPPTRTLKLQALRVGELGVTAIPCEVYGITGLRLKAQSTLVPTMNIELANGEEGYIPPPEQHALGGYSTWEARTSCLEKTAEPKIVDAVLKLLEEVSGQKRRPIQAPPTAYSKAVLASRPAAYWRLQEFCGPIAADAVGRFPGRYEEQIARRLEGPDRAGLGAGIRAPHFAGGRVKAAVTGLGDTYSVELWLWNGLAHDFRPVTGYCFARASAGQARAPGDHLGIGGKAHAACRLLFSGPDESKQALVGRTPLQVRTWYHVALVRDGRHVTVYLNGDPTPEISGETDVTGARAAEMFLGGRSDNQSNWEGKLCETAVFDRALLPDEIARHYRAAGEPGG